MVISDSTEDTRSELILRTKLIQESPAPAIQRHGGRVPGGDREIDSNLLGSGRPMVGVNPVSVTC